MKQYRAKSGFGLLGIVITLAIIVISYYLLTKVYKPQGLGQDSPRLGTIVDTAKKQLEEAQRRHADAEIE